MKKIQQLSAKKAHILRTRQKHRQTPSSITPRGIHIENNITKTWGDVYSNNNTKDKEVEDDDASNVDEKLLVHHHHKNSAQLQRIGDDDEQQGPLNWDSPTTAIDNTLRSDNSKIKKDRRQSYREQSNVKSVSPSKRCNGGDAACIIC